MKLSYKPIGTGRKPCNRWSRSSLFSKIEGMILQVTAVEPLEGHNLRLTFNDGLVRDVDLSFLLHGSLGEPLRDLAYFRQVRIDEEARTIVWPNGLDPDPEVLHGDRDPAEPAATQVSR